MLLDNEIRLTFPKPLVSAWDSRSKTSFKTSWAFILEQNHPRKYNSINEILGWSSGKATINQCGKQSIPLDNTNLSISFPLRSTVSKLIKASSSRLSKNRNLILRHRKNHRLVSRNRKRWGYQSHWMILSVGCTLYPGIWEMKDPWGMIRYCHWSD